MRIRKRWDAPRYFSSLTPPPAPPDLVSSTAQPPRPLPWPRTHRPQKLLHQQSRINVSICSNQNPRTGVGGGGGVATKEKRSTAINESVNDDKCSSSISTETSAANSVSSSLSRHGWWYEEEKVFPLKKRRISLERFTTQECENKNKEMKEVTNASWRCRRANGVGWRCSKQRLEGYAMCEHHINHSRMRDQKRRRNPPSNASRRYWGSNQQQEVGKDFRVGKKRRSRRRRMLMISTILDRTVPLLATS
ncbi:hypothetical protein P3X46_009334 [Hevea brasiliensis]|uniref:WRC domain-containing protein n=1 Tax=Hevea brasiliensis TaxID=3981 RepID=A0ABQ9MQL8_HEVBR|nr:uncharacterized protein LOC110646196 [Hevea brasiliensis]KAJ9181179.1 hypothetical protein P3X46_009334 [Hevea brasiliensis]